MCLKGRHGSEARVEGPGMYISRELGQRAALVTEPLTCGVKGTLSYRKTFKFTQIMLLWVLKILSHAPYFNSTLLKMTKWNQISMNSSMGDTEKALSTIFTHLHTQARHATFPGLLRTKTKWTVAFTALSMAYLSSEKSKRTVCGWKVERGT